MNAILSSSTENKTLDKGVGSRMKTGNTPDLSPTTTSTKAVDAKHISKYHLTKAMLML